MNIWAGGASYQHASWHLGKEQNGSNCFALRFKVAWSQYLNESERIRYIRTTASEFKLLLAAADGHLLVISEDCHFQ
jgi:hypothetical protein